MDLATGRCDKCGAIRFDSAGCSHASCGGIFVELCAGAVGQVSARAWLEAEARYFWNLFQWGFHPDTSAAEYVSASGRRSFNRHQCAVVDARRMGCFLVAERYGLDIYDEMMTAFHKFEKEIGRTRLACAGAHVYIRTITQNRRGINKMEMRLELKHEDDANMETVRAAFNTFCGLLDGTQAALTKARELYGLRSYVEIEMDSKSRTKVHCWIWTLVLGGSSIVGSGETWDEAFADAENR